MRKPRACKCCHDYQHRGNQPPAPPGQRRGLGLRLLADLGVEFGRRAKAFAGYPDRFLEFLLFKHGRRTTSTALKMRGEGLLRCRLEFAIHIQSRFFLPFATHRLIPTTFFCPNARTMYARTCLRARASRDITVPIGISSVWAISW